MTFDLVDHYGTPLGEFDSLEDAIVTLRRLVGSTSRRAYDLAILSFDDGDERVGGPITLDPANLEGPVIQHPHRAPAPPTPAEATNLYRSFGRVTVRTLVEMVQPAGSSSVGSSLNCLRAGGGSSARLPIALTG